MSKGATRYGGRAGWPRRDIQFAFSWGDVPLRLVHLQGGLHFESSRDEDHEKCQSAACRCKRAAERASGAERNERDAFISRVLCSARINWKFPRDRERISRRRDRVLNVKSREAIFVAVSEVKPSRVSLLICHRSCDG